MARLPRFRCLRCYKVRTLIKEAVSRFDGLFRDGLRLIRRRRQAILGHRLGGGHIFQRLLNCQLLEQTRLFDRFRCSDRSCWCNFNFRDFLCGNRLGNCFFRSWCFGFRRSLRRLRQNSRTSLCR